MKRVWMQMQKLRWNSSGRYSDNILFYRLSLICRRDALRGVSRRFDLPEAGIGKAECDENVNTCLTKKRRFTVMKRIFSFLIEITQFMTDLSFLFLR